MGIGPMMGAAADAYGSIEAAFYATAAFAFTATASAFLLLILKRREENNLKNDKAMKDSRKSEASQSV